MADDGAEIEVAEAEAAEAEALAAAARARARAVRLRQQAQSAREADETETGPTDAGDTDADADADADAEADADETEIPPTDAQPPRRRLWPVAAGAAIVVICALLGASGYITWQHHTAVQHRQRVAGSIAAAKQGVINMMSLDFHHAEEDIQRALDSSAGEFKDDFEKQAPDFIAAAKQSRVVSTGEVNSAAVESMDEDSAVVLVAATSYVTNSAGAKEEPRTWRLRVTATRDGDQVKMSKLVYVP